MLVCIVWYTHIYIVSHILLFISVENFTAVADTGCDELTISWYLEEQFFMLSQLNYTIALMSSEITRTFNISGSNCTEMNLQGVSCGEYLTLFHVTINGLQANQSYAVSLFTHVDSMYNVTNSSHNATARTTIPGLSEVLSLIVTVILYYVCNCDVNWENHWLKATNLKCSL